jgi:transposase
MGQRRKHSTGFKKRVALAALRESKTLAAIASEHQVHPMQVSAWKRQALDGLETVFQGARSRKELQQEYERRETQLLQKIGQLTVELDWLKKKTGD